VIAGSPDPSESVVAGMVKRDPETHGRVGSFSKLFLEDCRKVLSIRRDFGFGEWVSNIVDVNCVGSLY
jgi:hypothetical protein